MPTELKKRLQQARLEKKLTQAQLGQLINEKPNVSILPDRLICVSMCSGGCCSAKVKLHFCVGVSCCQQAVPRIVPHSICNTLHTIEVFWQSHLLCSTHGY